MVTAHGNELAMKQLAKSFEPDVVILEPERLKEKKAVILRVAEALS